MRYISTRGDAPVLDFEDVTLAGLARDGGLYLPERWPTLSRDEIAALAGLDYVETAVRVCAPFVCGALGEGELRALDGVTDVSVDLHAGGTSEVTVTSDQPLDRDAVAEAIDEAGYALASPRDLS